MPACCHNCVLHRLKGANMLAYLWFDMRACVRVCMHAQTCMCACFFLLDCLLACMRVSICVFVCVCVRLCVCTCVHAMSGFWTLQVLISSKICSKVVSRVGGAILNGFRINMGLICRMAARNENIKKLITLCTCLRLT